MFPAVSYQRHECVALQAGVQLFQQSPASTHNLPRERVPRGKWASHFPLEPRSNRAVLAVHRLQRLILSAVLHLLILVVPQSLPYSLVIDH